MSSHTVDDEKVDELDNKNEPTNYFEEPEDDDSAYLVRNDLTGQVSIASYGAVRNVHLQQETVFELKQQLELAKMSDMLFNRWGR